MNTSNPYRESNLRYRAPSGICLSRRSSAFANWVAARREINIAPYMRTMFSVPSNEVLLGDERGMNQRLLLNFSSQDYLSLSQSIVAKEAARDAIDRYGIHSAGSPVLVGRTAPMLELESRLASIFETETSVVYPTGWAAGFGVLVGVANSNDVILIDALAHNCLYEGAKHTGATVKSIRHNDIEDLRSKLTFVRSRDASQGIFVVIESLYSMDSDSPDINAVGTLCREFEAILVLDVAHDFGAMGADGLGLWGQILPENRPELIMGSFSKTFASNGGFVACSRDVSDYLRTFSPSWVFSNALSPIQASIVLACLRVAFSDEGKSRRAALLQNIELMRTCMLETGCKVGGTPSPIVPVYVGNEELARRTSREIANNGLAANLVEFPAVALDTARFRFQLMSTHTDPQIRQAVEITKSAVTAARTQMEQVQP